MIGQLLLETKTWTAAKKKPENTDVAKVNDGFCYTKNTKNVRILY